MANQSKLYSHFPRLLLLAALFLASPVWAIDCPQCGTRDIPSLVFACPKCSNSLHTVESIVKARSTATLVIEMLFTGEHPERLPDYGKLFINKKYKGNIPLIDREARDKVQLESDRKGLGHDYTAIFRTEKRDMDTGLYKVQVEMVFTRARGLMKSHRRVDFPRVMLKSGEKTFIRHAFSGPGDFQKKGGKMGKSENDTPYLNYGSGTVSLELPLLE